MDEIKELIALIKSTQEKQSQANDAEKAELKAKIEAMSTDLVSLQRSLSNKQEAEQSQFTNTISKTLAKSTELKDMLAGKVTSARITVEKTAILGTDATGKVPYVYQQPTRLAGVLDYANAPEIGLLDLIPDFYIPNQGSVEWAYAVESGKVDNLTYLADGDMAEDSYWTWDIASTTMKSASAKSTQSRQFIETAPAFADFTQMDLLRNYKRGAEKNALFGTGTGNDTKPQGIITSNQYTPFTPHAGEDALDSISRAIELVESGTIFNADTICLNTADVRALKRMRNSLGNFLIEDPFQASSSRVIGNFEGKLIVGLTNIPQGKILVADFKSSLINFIGESPTIEVGQINDDMARRKLTFVLWAKNVIACRYKRGVVYGDLKA